MLTATSNNDMVVNKTPCSQVMVKEYSTEESASSTEVAAQRQHRGSSTEWGTSRGSSSSPGSLLSQPAPVQDTKDTTLMSNNMGHSKPVPPSSQTCRELSQTGKLNPPQLLASCSCVHTVQPANTYGYQQLILGCWQGCPKNQHRKCYKPSPRASGTERSPCCTSSKEKSSLIVSFSFQITIPQ